MSEQEPNKISYEAGYKEGVKDGEGTKNGVKRYQMGFEDGRHAFIQEMLGEIKELAKIHHPVNSQCPDDCEDCDGFTSALIKIKRFITHASE